MYPPLQQLPNIPVRSAVIAALFPDIQAANKKIAQLERAGELIRLKRGLFVRHPAATDEYVSEGLVANHLCSPSYVSMQTALRHYGLIPEAVYSVQSMTLKRSHHFVNALGHFDYVTVPPEVFHIGLTREQQANSAFVIATPEKALCDLVAYTAGLYLRYAKEARAYLEEFLRFDMEAFARMNPRIFEAYAAVGKKSRSIRTLLKLLTDE